MINQKLDNRGNTLIIFLPSIYQEICLQCISEVTEWVRGNSAAANVWLRGRPSAPTLMAGMDVRILNAGPQGNRRQGGRRTGLSMLTTGATKTLRTCHEEWNWGRRHRARHPSAQTPTLTNRLMLICPRGPLSPGSAYPTPAWMQIRRAHTTTSGQAVSHGGLGPAEARLLGLSCQPSSRRTFAGSPSN